MPDNTIDSEVRALVDKIFNHGRAVEQHGSPYSHTPPKFYQELAHKIAQEANKAIENATGDITGPCLCGHSQHSRYVGTDCDSCSCQMFEPLTADKEQA